MRPASGSFLTPVMGPIDPKRLPASCSPTVGFVYTKRTFRSSISRRTLDLRSRNDCHLREATRAAGAVSARLPPKSRGVDEQVPSADGVIAYLETLWGEKATCARLRYRSTRPIARASLLRLAEHTGPDAGGMPGAPASLLAGGRACGSRRRRRLAGCWPRGRALHLLHRRHGEAFFQKFAIAAGMRDVAVFHGAAFFKVD